MSTDPGGAPNLPLDFDAWAMLSARLLRLDQQQRLDILDARGIDLDDWQRCDQHHCLELATDVAAGRMNRAETYGQICAAELARRRCEPTPPSQPSDAASPPAPEPEPPPSTPPPEPAELATFRRASVPLPTKTPASLTTTLDVPDFPSFLKQASALPFAGTTAPELATSTATPKGPAPVTGETLPLGTNLLAQMSGALPFSKRAADPALPRLPLQSYASLCAELAFLPDRATEIAKNYGIADEQARRALDEDWQARLAEHAETREEWQRLRTTYEDWLRRQPR